MRPATSIFLLLFPSPSCPSQPSLPLISLQVPFFSSPLPAPVPLLLLPFLVPPTLFPLLSPTLLRLYLLSSPISCPHPPRPAPKQRRAGWVAPGSGPALCSHLLCGRVDSPPPAPRLEGMWVNAEPLRLCLGADGGPGTSAGAGASGGRLRSRGCGPAGPSSPPGPREAASLRDAQAAAPSAPALHLAGRRVSPPGLGSRYPTLPPSVSPRTAQAGAQPWMHALVSVCLTPPDPGPSAQVCGALGLLCGEAPKRPSRLYPGRCSLL